MKVRSDCTTFYDPNSRSFSKTPITENQPTGHCVCRNTGDSNERYSPESKFMNVNINHFVTTPFHKSCNKIDYHWRKKHHDNRPESHSTSVWSCFCISIVHQIMVCLARLIDGKQSKNTNKHQNQ